MVKSTVVRGPSLTRLAVVWVLLSIGNTPALRVTLQAGRSLLDELRVITLHAGRSLLYELLCFKPAVNRQPGFRRWDS